jgi:hypothetical protein
MIIQITKENRTTVDFQIVEAVYKAEFFDIKVKNLLPLSPDRVHYKYSLPQLFSCALGIYCDTSWMSSFFEAHPGGSIQVRGPLTTEQWQVILTSGEGEIRAAFNYTNTETQGISPMKLALDYAGEHYSHINNLNTPCEMKRHLLESYFTNLFSNIKTHLSIFQSEKKGLSEAVANVLPEDVENFLNGE